MPPNRLSRRLPMALVGTPLIALALVGTAFVPSASAAQPVQLGTAAPFAVLAYSAVTNTGASSITGDVGLSPTAGTGITGLTQPEVNGTVYSTDGNPSGLAIADPGGLTTAKNDLSTAFTAAAGQSPITTFTAADNQLGGQTLVPGVYAFGQATSANLTGALVLNGNGVYVFQASSTLVAASNSVVALENGAQACNVFWEVGSSATLGTASTFVGTIMAQASISLTTGATVQGRLLAQTGAVTLQDNAITVPSSCASTTTTTTTTTTPATTPTTTATTTPVGTGGTGTTGGTGKTGGGAGSITTKSIVGSGEGSTGTGSAAGSGGSTAVVPSGFPHTGYGGAAHGRDDALIGLGALALVASTGALGLGLRRRRLLVDRPTHPGP